ncbi:MAG TPA: hypothetical protein VG275_00025, partial [Solirubrobacteraceae bacterium]|nr:hypothetical protein [Solirubrobacteraceae bacterium]
MNLLVLVLSFAIAGVAVAGWFQRPRDVATVLEWFAAAIVLHDLVVLPLYSLIDRLVLGVLPARARHARHRTIVGRVNSTPYLRIPALLSALLFVVFLPVIFGLGGQTELSASGIAESGYLARWLIASGVLFALSGAAFAVAVGRRGGRAVAAGAVGRGVGAPSGALSGAGAGAPSGAGAPPDPARPPDEIFAGVADAPEPADPASAADDLPAADDAPASSPPEEAAPG